ncbi:GroES-like protein [Mycena rosella]|uniref:GroES-like protein n=1 Tax=Mycena rosella TaxID=1033263 RepID=A0AAD7DK98_MYCRO|nr:GroES-like protein [Mycena rosella]
MSVEFTIFKGSASGDIVESRTRRGAPTETQVLHFKHADMALGHEGVGTVEQVGESVTGLKIGDIVGWGYLHMTCGTCEHCLLDLAPEHAAPLMCGGATVFEVLASYNIQPTDRVGVVGIGGLGHMAILFLAKMAMRLGASEFYVTQGVTKFEIGESLSHLLVATSFLPDWKPYLSVIKPKGTIYPLTVSLDDLVIPLFPVLVNGITIQGSAIAARSVHKKMLEFAARHRIEPVIETFPMTKSGVEEGMARLREGKIRYRAVLVA